MSNHLKSGAVLCLSLGVLGAASQAQAAEKCNIINDKQVAAVNEALTRPLGAARYTSLIVRLRPGAARPELGDLAQGAVAVGRTDDEIEEFVVAVPPGREPVALMGELAAQQAVQSVEPNYIFQIQRIPNDPCYPKQWHYRDRGTASDQSLGGIGLPATWATNTGANPPVVAVIDTGLLFKESDIAAKTNLVMGADLISDPGNAADGNGRDMDPTDPGDAYRSWHGTHVAGTIGALTTDNKKGGVSVSWKGRVLPVRVLGSQGGTFQDVADGILWAVGVPVAGVKTNPEPAKILNLSLGAQVACSSQMQSAVDAAVKAGAVVVVAAGNSSGDVANHTPANCKGVFSVAALNSKAELASYSNYGAGVSIAAPGGDFWDNDGDGSPDGVLSAIKGGFAYYQGTSMAAPHVAGVAALLWARTPGLSRTEVQDILTKGAVKVSCPKGCGAGLLNAGVAK